MLTSGNFLLMILLIGNGAHRSNGYSRGAPEEACLKMIPEHGLEPQTSPPPFSIQPSQTAIEKGGTVQVTIEAKNKEYFLGFMLQAVHTNASSVPLGRFINRPPQARLIDCPSGQQNVITHRDAKKKDKLVVTWQAPSDFEGDVEFKCTIASDYSTLWVKIPATMRVRVGRSVTANLNCGTNHGCSKPLVTVFDYFVWRIWFAHEILNEDL